MRKPCRLGLDAIENSMEWVMLSDLTEASVSFGGRNAYSGVSTSRTLMLNELTSLLSTVPEGANAQMFRTAVVDDNVLLKPSASTRSKTYSYLRDRYGLSPDVPVFRVLRLLWDRDESSQPLLALLVAIYRDPVLRSTVELILQTKVDEGLYSSDFGGAIDRAFPGRLGEKTLKSTGENTTSTYKQSGHLRSQNPGIRQRVKPTPGSVAMAMLLASLEGARGQALLQSPWVQLLDSTQELILSEARVAANRGWLEYRHAGDVLDITFHRLLGMVGADR